MQTLGSDWTRVCSWLLTSHGILRHLWFLSFLHYKVRLVLICSSQGLCEDLWWLPHAINGRWWIIHRYFPLGPHSSVSWISFCTIAFSGNGDPAKDLAQDELAACLSYMNTWMNKWIHSWMLKTEWFRLYFRLYNKAVVKTRLAFWNTDAELVQKLTCRQDLLLPRCVTSANKLAPLNTSVFLSCRIRIISTCHKNATNNMHIIHLLENSLLPFLPFLCFTILAGKDLESWMMYLIIPWISFSGVSPCLYLHAQLLPWMLWETRKMLRLLSLL